MRGDTQGVAKAKKATASQHLRVTVPFGTAPAFPFAKSTASENEELRDRLRVWEASDSDLIRRASELSGESPERIAELGALARARTLIFAIENQHAKKKGAKATHGIPGSADARLKVAYDELLAERKKSDITPSILGRRAKTGFRSAESWMLKMGLLPKDYMNRKAATRQARTPAT